MKTLLLTTIMALGTAAAGAQDAGDKAGTIVADTCEQAGTCPADTTEKKKKKGLINRVIDYLPTRTRRNLTRSSTSA